MSTEKNAQEAARNAYQDGAMLLANKKYAEAEAAFRTATDLDTSNAEYYQGLGISCYKQKKYVETETAFRTATDLDPENATYHQSLGAMCNVQGKYEEAAEHLNTAATMNNKHQPDIAKNLRSLIFSNKGTSITIAQMLCFVDISEGSYLSKTILEDTGIQEVLEGKTFIVKNRINLQVNNFTILQWIKASDLVSPVIQDLTGKFERCQVMTEDLFLAAGVFIKAIGKDSALNIGKVALEKGDIDAGTASYHGCLGSYYLGHDKLIEAAKEFNTAAQIDKKYQRNLADAIARVRKQEGKTITLVDLLPLYDISDHHSLSEATLANETVLAVLEGETGAKAKNKLKGIKRKLDKFEEKLRACEATVEDFRNAVGEITQIALGETQARSMLLTYATTATHEGKGDDGSDMRRPLLTAPTYKELPSWEHLVTSQVSSGSSKHK